ncbi:MAG TPA: PQQ-binding-like beta-propeller repeat protein [Gemmatimonadales bacterium]|nr:PQQ-binding-like beta-propeller repeat protein [Gemmatimonadales bacterium]
MRKSFLVILLVLLVVVGAAIALVSGSRRTPTHPIRPVNDEALLSPASTPGQWLLYGGDYSNQRHSNLSQINRETVARLGPVWKHDSWRLIVPKGRPETTPIAVDGMLIYTDAQNLVVAVDARDGRELWRYQYNAGSVALCCGLVNRGVAVYGDKVFFGTLDAELVALDRRTGALVWKQEIAQPSLGYSFTMAPLAADGKILIGASGGEFGIRGFLDAYDPQTGRRIWRFWTIPSPADGGWWGRWSPITPDGERLPRDIAQEKRDSSRFANAWQRGGGGIYSTPAYDPKLGLVIFGTGNPSPVDGVPPPGDNLYTTSLVAVDISTGKLRWFYQMVPHNIWDYDAASPVVLFDVTRGGTTIPAVAHAGKTGWVYILDRRTGKPLLRSDPLMPLENIFPAPSTSGKRTSPSHRGGANWPPPAYSSQTGLLYVLASYLPMTFVDKSEAGRKGVAGVFEPLPSEIKSGTVSAIDVATGKIRWQRKTPSHFMYGGALATAGGLVFYGEPSGYLNAVDAKSGEPLWRYRVVKGYTGPLISFELDGQQRIVVTTRNGIVALGLK